MNNRWTHIIKHPTKYTKFMRIFGVISSCLLVISLLLDVIDADDLVTFFFDVLFIISIISRCLVPLAGPSSSKVNPLGYSLSIFCNAV